MSPPSCSSQPKWRAFEVLGDDAGGIGAGPSAGAGGSWWEQMGTVYLVGFDHDRRVLREHTASSTQDTPGSIDIEWIPDGGSGFPGLSVRGLDDEDIYDTPAPAALAALCSTGNERLITACPPKAYRRTFCPSPRRNPLVRRSRQSKGDGFCRGQKYSSVTLSESISMDVRTRAVSENLSLDATVFYLFTPSRSSMMLSFIGRLEDRHSLLQH